MPVITELLEMKAFCKRKGIKLYLANNIQLAIKLGFDGAYIPAFNKSLRHLNYRLKKNFKILGSAHNIKEIRLKEKQNVCLIFISSIFKKNNIEPIKSINEKLDPNLHQAMMEIEDETKEPGTIVQEIQKGFMMKDRLLRPALVGVAKRKPEEQSKDEQKTQENQAEKDKN